MLKKQYLMIPGPTVVPEQVMRAMCQPMINHRGPEYKKMYREIIAGLQKVVKTHADILTFPASGTGMLEAAVVNLFSPGDKVLAVSIGVFGDRFAEIAARFGVTVEKMAFPWGTAADPQQVAARLARDTNHEIKAVLVTHNETSTGVANDLQAISIARGEHPALLVVDAVSSLGAINLEMDAWGVDVVVAGSQKALMIPPGLGVMALSDRAEKAIADAELPKYYWDANRAKKAAAKGQNPYTPPISLLFGLAESLKMMQDEGLDEIFARHLLLRDALRAGIKAMGLEVLAEDAAASPTVTAVLAPRGIEGKKIQDYLKERFGIIVAGGQAELENKIFRIGHLGYTGEMDIVVVLAALEMTLAALGMPVQFGNGVAAAQKIILGAN